MFSKLWTLLKKLFKRRKRTPKGRNLVYGVELKLLKEIESRVLGPEKPEVNQRKINGLS